MAVIKLDIEGSEALVMQDAIELITKYHIPYVLAEYSKTMIRAWNKSSRFYKIIYR